MPDQTVFFEKFTVNDFQLYFKLVSNFEVMKMITEKSLTEKEADDDFDKVLKNNSIHPFLGTYKVFNSSHDFLGLAKLELKSIDDTEAELGYMLLPHFWGQGLGYIIAQALLKISLQEPKLRSLIAIIDPNNIASRKILLKNGFYSKAFKDFDGLPGEILELCLQNKE